MKLKYYRVWDTQINDYFATGYNAYGVQELLYAFRSYLSVDGVSPSSIRTLADLNNHFGDVVIESSYEPFEDVKQ